MPHFLSASWKLQLLLEYQVMRLEEAPRSIHNNIIKTARLLYDEYYRNENNEMPREISAKQTLSSSSPIHSLRIYIASLTLVHLH